MQSGEGPGDLAWHDCEFVLELQAAALPPPPPPPAGMGPLIEKITQSISARVDKFNARDLADVLDSLARLREAEKSSGEANSGGASLRLLAALASEDA